MDTSAQLSQDSTCFQTERSWVQMPFGLSEILNQLTWREEANATKTILV